MRISKNFIFELVRQDLKESFAGSMLGTTWVFIWPLVQLFIYIIIFGKIMGGRLPGNSQVYAYGIYVACGLIPWTCFVNTLIRTSRAFLDKKNILSKIQVPLAEFPLFIPLAEAVPFVFSMGVLLAVAIGTGIKFEPFHLLLIPVVFYLQQVMAYGLGIFLATFSVFFRDITEIVSIGTQLWFWFTPIVYTASILPEFVAKILCFNPFFIVASSMHDIFIYNKMPDLYNLLFLGIGSHLFLFLSFYILRRLESDVRDFL